MNDMILSGTTTEELAAVVAAHSPDLTHEEASQIAEQAARLQISPEAMQKILEGFETVAEALRKIVDAIEKYESYMRRTLRIHGAALVGLAELNRAAQSPGA